MQSLGAPDQMDALTRYCLQSQLEKFCQTYPERAHWLERWIMHGDSLHDISAALGRTTAASKEYLSQCRQRLQQHLKQCLTH